VRCACSHPGFSWRTGLKVRTLPFLLDRSLLEGIALVGQTYGRRRQLMRRRFAALGVVIAVIGVVVEPSVLPGLIPGYVE
jgi:hypothetical protein